MRKFLTLFIIILTTGVFAQTPQRINYQAVARDASGNIVTGAIGIKFQILQGSASGTVIYEETHTASPSSAGIFDVQIGGGSVVLGNFATIPWGTNSYFLRVNIDPAGGTSYSTVGTSQFISVPYALFAEKTSPPVLSVTPSGTANILSVGPSTVAIPAGSAAASPTLIGVSPVTVTPVPAVGTPTAYLISSSTSTSVGTSSLQINSPHTVTTLSANNYSINIAPPVFTNSGIANVTGTFPNYNVAVPAPVLSVSGNSITVTSGTAVSTQTFGPGPWTQSSGAVSLTNSSDIVQVGGTGTAKLNVATTNTFTGNDLSIVSQSSNDAMQVFKFSGTGAALRLINSSTTNTSVATITSSGGGNPVGFDINVSSNNSALTAKSSGTAATVYAINTFVGPSIKAEKQANSGPAGVFDISTTSNNNDALVAVTQGTGAAVRANAGTANTSAMSLVLDNGHVKSVSVAPPIVAISSNSLGAAANPTITGNSTDVKGIVTVLTNPTGAGNGSFVDVNVTFNKAYAQPPTVIISQYDVSKFSYAITSINNTSFIVRIFNNTAGSLTAPSGFLRFSYMVIE